MLDFINLQFKFFFLQCNRAFIAVPAEKSLGGALQFSQILSTVDRTIIL